MSQTTKRKVLVIGVYLVDVPNLALEITTELGRAAHWSAEVRWAALGAGAPPDALAEVTRLQAKTPVPKFELLNRLIDGVAIEDYDFLIVTDDDVELGAGFVDAYLAAQERHRLALCQPARTHDSYIDHYFVARLEGVEARRTRFVEIGPVFSIAREAFPILLPFDEAAPMGWGLDFVWPTLIEDARLAMGIVDGVPVRHALRKPVTHYSWEETSRGMEAYLSSRGSLARGDAFVALETFAGEPAAVGRRGPGSAPGPSGEPHRLPSPPLISALICTYNRAPLLREALQALCAQTLERGRFEVIVVDDGSSDDTRQLVESFAALLPLRYAYQENSGLASGKNHGLFLARAPLVCFMDDDDVADPRFLEEHYLAHQRHPADQYAVLSHTDLAGPVRRSPLMHYVTEVRKHLFSYPDIRDGQVLDFSYFWGGRSSCKRGFLLEYGVFNPTFRFGAEDIELGYRLARHGLKVVYARKALSHMIRTLSFDDFCRRCYLQGRSNGVFYNLHPEPAVSEFGQIAGVHEEWSRIEPRYDLVLKMGRDLHRFADERARVDLPLQDRARDLLYRGYDAAFRASRIKGTVETVRPPLSEAGSGGPAPGRSADE